MNSPPISRFIEGLTTPIVGLKLIFSSRKIFILSVIPFLLGISFVFLGFYFASEYLIPYMQSWLNIEPINEHSQIYLRLLYAIFLLASWLIIATINFLFGYIFILIFVGPFYALLVSSVFQAEGVSQTLPMTLSLNFKMVLIGLMKVVLFSIIGIACFLLSFVPLVNFITPLIVLLLVAYDCMDYSFEVDALGLVERFHFFRKQIFEFLGIATMIFLSNFLPGSFFILLPAFICGATKIYIQKVHKNV